MVASSDLQINNLQAILRASLYCESKGLDWEQLSILIGVQQFIKLSQGRAYPNASQIGQLIGIAPADFKSNLTALVELRYLHEMHPTYGELIYTYKLGSLGGTLFRQIFPAQKIT